MRTDLVPVRAQVLAVRLIANVDRAMAARLGLSPFQRSVGLLTATSDDVGYTAVDEATKQAAVAVVYAKSFYAGAAHASGPLSGEFIGMLAGPDPAAVRSGLEVAVDVIEHQACFYAANADGTLAFYPHLIARSGTYLSKVAGIPAGSPLAYLIAPPLEAMYALDLALKASEVRIAAFYGPPTETNYGGGLLTGALSACQAACDAFADGVLAVAGLPLKY